MKKFGWAVVMVTDMYGGFFNEPIIYTSLIGDTKSEAIIKWNFIEHHDPHTLTRKRLCCRTIVIPVEYNMDRYVTRAKVQIEMEKYRKRNKKQRINKNET